ncbi:MAG: cytochrome c-type biogenesis protein CcmH [Oligoflexia bacterium]|nr:cytochrome c-type biogenesis protein CcmH [Oligoflexia bacterium]
MGFRFYGVLIAICLVVSTTQLVFAQSDAASDQTAHQIYSTVMSPFCPGRLLNDCPSPDAAELKHRIREQLASGESSDQIIKALVTKYGDKLRAAPGFSGFGAAAYLVPAIFVLFGIGAIVFWLRRARQPGSEAEQINDDVDPSVAEEIERIIRD